MRDLKKHLNTLHGSAETLRINCHIDKDLYKKFKKQCTDEDCTITSKIEELIQGYLAHRPFQQTEN